MKKVFAGKVGEYRSQRLGKYEKKCAVLFLCREDKGLSDRNRKRVGYAKAEPVVDEKGKISMWVWYFMCKLRDMETPAFALSLRAGLEVMNTWIAMQDADCVKDEGKTVFKEIVATGVAGDGESSDPVEVGEGKKTGVTQKLLEGLHAGQGGT